MRQELITRRLEVASRAGMHARPGAQIDSSRKVRIGACMRSYAVNGKSIAWVTALAAARGLARTARASTSSGIPVSLRGEPAAPARAPAPVTGPGLRQLSPPPAAAGIKRIIHNMPALKAAALAFHARRAEGPDRMERLSAGFTARTPKRSEQS